LARGRPHTARDYEIFELGDFQLESGEVLRDAKLAYKTHGALDAAGSNAVVFPTAYGGTHADNEWLIAAGKALDPAHWFVVCPNLFGAGLSSSPSNTPGPQDGPRFPHVSVYDNIVAQHRLLTEQLGITKLALAIGFSMGAQQAFHWGAAYPEMVERIAPFCGSARTAEHNIVFLDGAKAALAAGGPPTLGAYWAAWGLSQTFYREERWRELGGTSRQAFVQEFYIDSFSAGNADNLMAMIGTWRSADVGRHPRYGNDTIKALQSIRARAVVMPCRTDLYFPPEDSEIEVRHLPNAELHVIPGVYGHAAGGGVNPEASAFIDRAVTELLASQGVHA